MVKPALQTPQMRFVLKNQAEYALYANTHLILKLLENAKFTRNKGTKMKYRIPETIILQTIDNETIKDIVYHELNEQEFLVEYLKNPKLSYWQDHPDGTKQHYKNGKLMVTIFGDQITNHMFLDKNAK